MDGDDPRRGVGGVDRERSPEDEPRPVAGTDVHELARTRAGRDRRCVERLEPLARQDLAALDELRADETHSLREAPSATRTGRRARCDYGREPLEPSSSSMSSASSAAGAAAGASSPSPAATPASGTIAGNASASASARSPKTSVGS